MFKKGRKKFDMAQLDKDNKALCVQHTSSRIESSDVVKQVKKKREKKCSQQCEKEGRWGLFFVGLSYLSHSHHPLHALLSTLL
jgi:hypothetical protein